jgi:hypothetical protein
MDKASDFRVEQPALNHLTNSGRSVKMDITVKPRPGSTKDQMPTSMVSSADYVSGGLSIKSESKTLT